MKTRIKTGFTKHTDQKLSGIAIFYFTCPMLVSGFGARPFAKRSTACDKENR